MTQNLAADLELNDTRVEFICDYVLKTFKIKGDKWMKLYNVEDNKAMILTFLEKPEIPQILISLSPAGLLSVTTDWPGNLKSKSCYFVRKGKDPILKDGSLRNMIMYGDLSYSPVEQLSAFVDEVSPTLLWKYLIDLL